MDKTNTFLGMVLLILCGINVILGFKFQNVEAMLGWFVACLFVFAFYFVKV